MYAFIPENFMDVHIVPLVKNKTGNLSQKDNYRPISLLIIMSKIFETILLFRCEEFLISSDNQFAYKKEHSTELCIYVLKQTVFDYNNNHTPVFACFFRYP